MMNANTARYKIVSSESQQCERQCSLYRSPVFLKFIRHSSESAGGERTVAQRPALPNNKLHKNTSQPSDRATGPRRRPRLRTGCSTLTHYLLSTHFYSRSNALSFTELYIHTKFHCCVIV